MPLDILSDSMHTFLPELVMSAYKEFPDLVLGYIFISFFCTLVNEDRSPSYFISFFVMVGFSGFFLGTTYGLSELKAVSISKSSFYCVLFPALLSVVLRFIICDVSGLAIHNM